MGGGGREEEELLCAVVRRGQFRLFKTQERRRWPEDDNGGVEGKV